MVYKWLREAGGSGRFCMGGVRVDVAMISYSFRARNTTFCNLYMLLQTLFAIFLVPWTSTPRF